MQGDDPFGLHLLDAPDDAHLAAVQRQGSGAGPRAGSAAPSTLGEAIRAAIEAANAAYAGLMNGRYPDAAMTHLAGTLDAVIEALHRHAGMRSPADEQALIDVKRLTVQVADKLASVFGPHDGRGQPLRARLARIESTALAAAFAPAAVEMSQTEALEVVDRSMRQLQRAHELGKGFDEVDLHELARAMDETAEMKATVATSPAAASRLGMAISSQQSFLFEVAGELEVVVAASGGRHGGKIVAAYVRAMARSVGRRDRAEHAIEAARRLRKGEPLAQAADVLDEDDASIAAMRTMDGHSTALAERAHDKLDKRRAQLEKRIARGERVDDLEAPQLLFDTREQTFQNQLTVLSLQARQLAAGLDSVDDGVLGTLANGWDKNLPRLIGDLRGLDNVIKSARAGYRARLDIVERRDDLGDIDAPRRVLAGKTAALDEMETFLRDWLSTGYFAERTDAAAEALKDAQLALMAVNFSATVALIVVGNAAAAAARGLATGAVVAGASRFGVAGARVGQIADTVGAGAAFAADVAVNTAGQRYIQGDDASLASLLAVNVTSPLAIGAISKRFPALRPLSRKDFHGKSLWEKSKLGGGFVLRQGAELSVEMIAGIAIDFANRQAFQQRAAGPLPENTESWLLQGASMALGRFVGFRMKARMDAIAQLTQGATVRATLESHARAIEESAQQLEASGDVEAATEVLGKYHEYLDQERALLAEEMAAQNDGTGTIDRDGLAALMRANGLGRSELGKLGMEELALRAAGLEAQNASGKVWEGTADQLDSVRARAVDLGLAMHVEIDPGSGRKLVTVGAKSFEVVERGATTRAASTPAEHLDASRYRPVERPRSGTMPKDLLVDQQTGKQYLFKPNRPDAPLPMRAVEHGLTSDTIAQRAKAAEVAAHQLAIDTPDVRFVEYRGQVGSLQEWRTTKNTYALGQVEHDDPQLFARVMASPEYARLRADLDTFDYVINNLDRNANNVLVTVDDSGAITNLTAIDHDLTFSGSAERFVDELGTWARDLPDRYNKAMVERLRAIAANPDGFRNALRAYLKPDEIESAVSRAHKVLADVDAKIAARGPTGTFFENERPPSRAGEPGPPVDVVESSGPALVSGTAWDPQDDDVIRSLMQRAYPNNKLHRLEKSLDALRRSPVGSDLARLLKVPRIQAAEGFDDAVRRLLQGSVAEHESLLTELVEAERLLTEGGPDAGLVLGRKSLGTRRGAPEHYDVDAASVGAHDEMVEARQVYRARTADLDNAIGEGLDKARTQLAAAPAARRRVVIYLQGGSIDDLGGRAVRISRFVEQLEIEVEIVAPDGRRIRYTRAGTNRT